MIKKSLSILAIAIASHSAQAELKALDNTDLSEIAGQSGLSVDISKLANLDSQLNRPEKQHLTIEQIDYQTSGSNNESNLLLNNIELGLVPGANTALTSTGTFDIGSDGRLHVVLNQNLRRLSIGDVTLGSAAVDGKANVWKYNHTGTPATSLYVPVETKGRYVRVQLGDQNALSLAEVQIFNEANSNIALSQSTTQSTEAHGGLSSRAVDGNTDGIWANESVTHTDNDVNAWWQVDLGSETDISHIQVFNRTDCCNTRLSDFRIYVSDTPFGSKTFAELEADYSNRSYGQFTFDYGLQADLYVEAKTSGLRITGSLASNDGNFFYRDDSTDLIASDFDISIDTNRSGSYAELAVVDVSSQNRLRLSLNDLRLNFNLGAVRHGLNYNANGHTSGANVSESFGNFTGAFNYSGTFDLAAGGQTSGSGLTLIPQLEINCTGTCLTATTTDNSNFINYFDDGVRLGMANYFGVLKSSGITLDFIQQRTLGSRGDYALLSVNDLDWTFGVEDIFIGNAPTSLGKLFGQFRFGNIDAFTGTTSATNLNQIKLYPGGAQGNAGLTADINWNLESGDLRYADDGQYIWFTGLASKGSGTSTVDMVQGNENGLKLGLENFNGSYRFKGLYIGENLPDEATLKNKRQGGVELLYALGIYQSMDFGDLDGSIVLSGGGNSGTGIGFDSDFVFTGTNAGLLVDYDTTGCEQGCGLWATGMTLESHTRNGTFDVESISGFKALDASGNLNASAREAMVMRSNNYGYTDIGELRIGKVGNTNSLGSITTSSYSNSTVAIATGGDPNRGAQGISIYQKEELLATNGTYTDNTGATRSKTNSLRWTPDSSKSGHYLELGNLNTDSFGIQNTLNVDVAANRNNQTGFAVNALTEFQQVHIDQITVGTNPIVQDAYMYNVRLNSNIVATPLN